MLDVVSEIPLIALSIVALAYSVLRAPHQATNRRCQSIWNATAGLCFAEVADAIISCRYSHMGGLNNSSSC